MSNASTLRHLLQIRAHNRKRLDAFSGILGTALGFKKPTGGELTDRPAVLVFVPQKVNPKWLPASAVLPKELEGPGGLRCPVDVVEGAGEEPQPPVAEELGELARRLRGWDDQIGCGSQLAPWTDVPAGPDSTGTLGAWVKRRSDGKLGLLANQHVATGIGTPIFHPVPWGTRLGRTAKSLAHVRDEHWYGAHHDEHNTFVRVDCGFVELDPSFDPSNINPDMLGVGSLGEVLSVDIDSVDILGQPVVRVDRTTGQQKGTVVGFGYEYRDEAGTTVYTDLLITGDQGRPFSWSGDGGSLIVTDDEHHRPVGLVWGGWRDKLRRGGTCQVQWAYGIALARVLEALQLDLVRTTDRR